MSTRAASVVRPIVDVGSDKAAFVRSMFDGIAQSYDVMNRIMTGGFDGTARRLAAEAVYPEEVGRALDIGCGTGDLTTSLAARTRGATVIGLDFSAGMLAIAKQKSSQIAAVLRPPLVRGDATQLAVGSGVFDAVVSSWVLRNVTDIDSTFREACRILRPGGRAAFLELTPLRTPVIGWLFRLYFHGLVPLVGAAMSGDRQAYRYLPESVDRFPEADALARQMSAAGFVDVSYTKVGFGTLAIHVGTAPIAAPDQRRSSLGEHALTSPAALEPFFGSMEPAHPNPSEWTAIASRDRAPTPLVRRWPSGSDAWNRALASIPGAHALNTWEWGVVRATSGWQVERVLWERDGRPVAAAQILRRALPIPGVGVAYVPKGPVVAPDTTDAWPEVLESLAQWASARRCLFIKVDPDVPSDARGIRRVLRTARFFPSRQQVQYPATMVVDLDGTDEVLLSRMRATWRRYIRKSERDGVTVERMQQPDEHAVGSFLRLYTETALRDGFVRRSDAYYSDAIAALTASGRAILFVARREGVDHAAAVVLRFGTSAWYLWGATSAVGLSTHAMYRLQWEAMRWCRDDGATRYDMWGAPDVADDVSDPLAGVAYFKRGFGARHVRWIGAYDYSPFPLLYRLWLFTFPRTVAMVRWIRREKSGHAVLTPA